MIMEVSEDLQGHLHDKISQHMIMGLIDNLKGPLHDYTQDHASLECQHLQLSSFGIVTIVCLGHDAF